MADENRIRDVVRSVLEERFDNLNVLAINIKPDVDVDGDEIISIRVVFDGKKKRLDPKKTSSILRHLIPKIRESGETGFPTMSFVSKSDLGKLPPEAA